MPWWCPLQLLHWLHLRPYLASLILLSLSCMARLNCLKNDSTEFCWNEMRWFMQESDLKSPSPCIAIYYLTYYPMVCYYICFSCCNFDCCCKHLSCSSIIYLWMLHLLQTHHMKCYMCQFCWYQLVKSHWTVPFWNCQQLVSVDRYHVSKSSFSAICYIIFSRSSPKDPMGAPPKEYTLLSWSSAHLSAALANSQ